MLKSALRALPLFLAYGQLGLIAIVDTAFVSSMGATQVAAIGFGGSVLLPFYIFSSAPALALAPIVVRAEARSGLEGGLLRLVECLRMHALLVAASMLVMTWLGGHLDWFGQPEAVAGAALPYFRGMMFTLVPVSLFAALREYAIAVRKPWMPTLTAALALVFKVGLTRALVHGWGPIAALGPTGAPVASVIAYGGALLVFVVLLLRNGRLAGLRGAVRRLSGEPILQSDLVGQGLAVSLQQLFEVGAYYFVGIMAGWLGTSALAAHQIGLNVANVGAILSLAIAQITAAEVGRKAKEHPAGVGHAARAGAVAAVGAMALLGAVVIVAREPLFAAASGYTALALFVAPSLAMDAVQLVLAGALRGLLDAKFVSVVTFVAWWLFCLPVAYVLGVVLHLGIGGMWGALLATLLLTAMIFGLRLRRLVARGSAAVGVPAVAMGGAP